MSRFAAVRGAISSGAAPWLAIVLLNASLTFHNVWPTPKVQWQGDVSIELAASILILSLVARWRQAGLWRVAGWLAVVWTLLVVGRYADTTAPALYGRDINLFWDARHLRAVAEMMTDAASTSLIVGITAAVVAVLVVLFFLSRWSFRSLSNAMTRPVARGMLEAAAAVLLVAFVAQKAGALPEGTPGFSPPVSQTYARQARLALNRLTAQGLPPQVPGSVDSDLSRVSGADVLLIFAESYGAVAYDRFGAELSEARARFLAEVESSGRAVVSAFVDSPTFGGSSWLAHVSLMSGVETRDEDTNVVLMAQTRETLPSVFERRGYRTVALMPGLQSTWPEGGFYGFDQVYGTTSFAYRGPRFGWWIVPDQFALARLDVMEAAADSKKPRFVFFPTTSTHAPFGPTAPYQPDWARLLTDDPFDTADVRESLSHVPDWLNLAPSYVGSVRYMYTSFGGYLKRHADRPLVMVLLGDHQPAAAVTGEGASWDVPVHIIAPTGPILDRLVAAGFARGLTPPRPRLGKMNELLPLLLDAFGDTSRDSRTPKTGVAPTS